MPLDPSLPEEESEPELESESEPDSVLPEPVLVPVSDELSVVLVVSVVELVVSVDVVVSVEVVEPSLDVLESSVVGAVGELVTTPSVSSGHAQLDGLGLSQRGFMWAQATASVSPCEAVPPHAEPIAIVVPIAIHRDRSATTRITDATLTRPRLPPSIASIIAASIAELARSRRAVNREPRDRFARRRV